jgi:transcriptional regulator with XRE-family HTH domain
MRADAALTQAELAERLSRPQSYVSKIETGERRIDLAELRLLTEALGLSLVEVVAQWIARLG